MQISEKDKELIKQAVHAAEARTSADIVVHLRKKCRTNPLEDAKRYFVNKGLDRTRERNAVLIFVGRTSRRFAILGDEAIHEKVGEEYWQSLVGQLSVAFSVGQYTEGLIDVIRQLGDTLSLHFPYRDDAEHIETLSED